MTKKNSSQRPLRVGLISLGCAKNLVDAEIMLGSLMKSGVEITNDAAQADAVIVNTCSFIDSAQEESVDTILESVEVRDAKQSRPRLIVSGCLPQRFRDELPKLMPEVDAFMGIDQVAQVGDIVKQRHAKSRGKSRKSRNPEVRSETENFRAVDRTGKEARPCRTRKIGNHPRDGKIRENQNCRCLRKDAAAPIFDVTAASRFHSRFRTPRFRLTPKHFAYLKIAEGCNHPCSFCIIPRMRGSHRSRTQSDIVAEAKALIADGVKEINLISQDSTYYGLDLRPNHRRAISSPEKFSAAAKSLAADAHDHLHAVARIEFAQGDFWIRLLYTHPAHWTDELIQTIAECKKVARYVDIPLQHIHENMLERMRRETSQQYIVDLIQKIRAGIPGIALRTTFIVGFPGETEESFETLLDFIRETKFERLGVFTYSQEDGTRAGKNGRTNSRQGETKAPRTRHGRATQNRRANFRILRWPRNQSAR